MNFELSRSELENLLAGFLAGTQCVELKTRITELKHLSAEYRTHVQCAKAKGRAWTAWSTELGILVAWGDYDIAASRRLDAFVLCRILWNQLRSTRALVL